MEIILPIHVYTAAQVLEDLDASIDYEIDTGDVSWVKIDYASLGGLKLTRDMLVLIMCEAEIAAIEDDLAEQIQKLFNIGEL